MRSISSMEKLLGKLHSVLHLLLLWGEETYWTGGSEPAEQCQVQPLRETMAFCSRTFCGRTFYGGTFCGGTFCGGTFCSGTFCPAGGKALTCGCPAGPGTAGVILMNAEEVVLLKVFGPRL